MSKRKFPWHVAYTYSDGSGVKVASSTITKNDKSLLSQKDLDECADYIMKYRNAISVAFTFFSRMQTITKTDEETHERA